MAAEQIIAEIESLEHIFKLSDTRPLTSSDLSAANRPHDEMHAPPPVVPVVADIRHLLPT